VSDFSVVSYEVLPELIVFVSTTDAIAIFVALLNIEPAEARRFQ